MLLDYAPDIGSNCGFSHHREAAVWLPSTSAAVEQFDPWSCLERTVTTKYHLGVGPIQDKSSPQVDCLGQYICLSLWKAFWECRRKWSKTVHKWPHSNFLAIKCDIQAAQSNTSSSLATIQRDHNVFLDRLKSKCLKNPQPQTNYRKHEYISNGF